ncbi:MAG: hypothetical protein LBM97_02390 [Candidatus Nomurabacteria bacterium]|nr:hypothetical protein [Candidatus Nomurabacteria bacterium]
MVDVVYMMTKTAYTFNYINSLNIDYSKDISGIINKVHDLKFDDLEWTKTMKNVLTTRGDTSAAMKKRPIISWLEEFYSAKKQKDGF